MTASPPLPDGISGDDVQNCLRILTHLARQPELCDTDPRLAAVRDHAGRLMRVSRKMNRREERGRDRELLDTATGIRAPVGEWATAVEPILSAARRCYVCHQTFTRIHHFYDSLCPDCAETNYRKRQQAINLNGRVALVTGGRVKIGHQVALTLLRWGARVLVTTPSPVMPPADSARSPTLPTGWIVSSSSLSICAGCSMWNALAIRFVGSSTGSIS